MALFHEQDTKRTSDWYVMEDEEDKALRSRPVARSQRLSFVVIILIKVVSLFNQ